MIDLLQLKALATVAQAGSFETAATHLHITQSAVSQRIKALEERIGAPVILREQPCRPTDVGARLIRHFNDVALIESATRHDLGLAKTQDRPTVAIAVNADSLATWLLPALAKANEWLFDITIDDQDHSADWLRSGKVAAAVTARAEPVTGCDVYPLGALDYRATASPDFVERYFADGLTADSFRKAPALSFNAKDRLQIDFVYRETGKRIALPSHIMASTESFVAATELGMGWALNPICLIRSQLEQVSLVTLSDEPVLIPLYWQISRLVKTPLLPLTQSIRAAANNQLDPSTPSRA